MTPEQESKLNEVYSFIQMLKAANTIPLEVDQALQGRGFPKSLSLLTLTTLSGIIKASAGSFSAVAGISGTFYAANVSGGAVTHLVTVSNGVITAIA